MILFKYRKLQVIDDIRGVLLWEKHYANQNQVSLVSIGSIPTVVGNAHPTNATKLVETADIYIISTIEKTKSIDTKSNNSYAKKGDNHMPILQKPRNGWSALCFKEYYGRLSYIDDVPSLICQLIQQYQANKQAVTTFDCEGYSFTLVLTECSIDVLEFKDEIPTLFHIQGDPDVLCKQLIQDLQTYLTAWVNTYYYPEEEKTEWKQYHQHIQQQLQICTNGFFTKKGNQL